MNGIKTRLGDWRRIALDRRGNVAIVFAICLPLIAGSGALGLETGVWYYDQLKLQQTADAAAYAGGVDKRAGKTNAVATSSAQASAADNGFNAATDAMTINAPPTSGPHQDANSVEVVLSRTEPRYFSQIFLSKPVVLRARAVSTYVNASNACILALDPSASRAIQFSGSSTVNLGGCDVMANSIASDAVYAQGSNSVTTPCLMTAGGVLLNAGVHLTGCTAPLVNQPPVGDPYASLPAPAVATHCTNLPQNPPPTLSPGTYCGISLKGSVTLNPGVYVIDGGTLSSNGSAIVSGQGVTFYLTNGASISLNGSATLNFSAPTSGTYSGVLFFGGHGNAAGGPVTMDGTASSQLTGVLYFPAQSLSYIGNFNGNNGCTQVVAKTVSWSGNSNLAVNCTAAGFNPIVIGGVVRLAE